MKFFKNATMQHELRLKKIKVFATPRNATNEQKPSVTRQLDDVEKSAFQLAKQFYKRG